MLTRAYLFFSIGVVFFGFQLLFPSHVYANETVKPALSWQRSSEQADKVITETTVWTKVNEALALPLDTNQNVFDNGTFTPDVNKSAVASQVSWSSWPQYSAPSATSCGPIFELRHFQAKFNLSGISPTNTHKIRLKSPYYSNDIIPINDNLYIYLNGHLIKRVGTSYGALNSGMQGHAPFANETDGWYAGGDLGQEPAAYLQNGQNALDLVTGETCRWGGMGKLELVLEVVPPTPFLDLPWGYQGKGLSFNDAALAINSYFDHEYPLLSSGLSEPPTLPDSIVNFLGFPRINRPYSSHDGYDYGKSASVNIGDPVLAAANGCASYIKYNDGNHVIKIDHENGYQTRYLHLQDDQFLITRSQSCVNVGKGQRIGSVGFSGTVKPSGPQGAHIHFMVIQDKNGDGNFEDNIPDGVTDPFGWQSTDADPWPAFTFNYGGQTRTGHTSFYLFTKAIANLSSTLTSNGGFFELERYKLNFPQGATNQNLNLQMQSAPNAKPSNILESIGSTIEVTARNALGGLVNTFQGFFTITIDFSTFDLTGHNTDTLSIYSSDDGINWTKELTDVNLVEKTASANLNHLTHFALMAERIDTIAPVTNAVIVGDQGQENWHRSNVQVTLDAQDNQGGQGIDYTLYKVNGGDWQQYVQSLTFVDEGSYTIDFYSADKSENIENIKSVTFNIDKTLPEAKVFVDQDLQDLAVQGVDQNQTTISRSENIETKKEDDTIYIISDLAGNTLRLDVRDRDKIKQDRFKIYTLKYDNEQDVIEPDNHYNVSYEGEKDKLNVDEQSFEIKGEVKIRIKYDSKKDQSTIYTKEEGQEKLKQIKDGLALLQLQTNKGNLEYSY